MYHCPRCKIELPADAIFCNNCGFNQTNARMRAVGQKQAKPSEKSTARSIQPQVKRTPAQRAGQPDAGAPAPSAQEPSMQSSPTAPVSGSDQSVKDEKGEGSLQPVRVNTPKNPDNAPAPQRPVSKVPAKPSRDAVPPVEPASAPPAHLTGLEPTFVVPRQAQRPASSSVPETPAHLAGLDLSVPAAKQRPATPPVPEMPAHLAGLDLETAGSGLSNAPSQPDATVKHPEKAEESAPKKLSLTKRYLEGQYGQEASVAKGPVTPLPALPLSSSLDAEKTSIAPEPAKSPMPPLPTMPAKSPMPPMPTMPAKSPTPPLSTMPAKSPMPPMPTMPAKSPTPPMPTMPAKSPTPLPIPVKSSTPPPMTPTPAKSPMPPAGRPVMSSQPPPISPFPPTTPAPSAGPAAHSALQGNGMGAIDWDSRDDEWEDDPLGVFAHAGTSAESMSATSRAAERWRTSWRDRQRAEAGPAVGVSRGQASVAEPLLAMQHSIARMRAVILPKPGEEQKRGRTGFWLTLIALLCLLGGLGAYIVSSFAPDAHPRPLANAAPVSGGPVPVLSIPAGKSTAVLPGHNLLVHGDGFGADHAITFVLDTTPLHANANSFVQSDHHGAFDASLLIDTAWQAGNYALLAQDSRTGQHALLSVQVLPSANSANTTALQVMTQAQTVQNLSFKMVYGQQVPDAQWISLVNTSDTDRLVWSVDTITSTGVNWLSINDSKTNGKLDAGASDELGIGIQSVGLASSATPYQGYIIITVEKQGQVVLPVTLLIQNSAIEVAITPNPIIALLKPATQGACQDISLTLVNMSNQVVFWNANPFVDDQNYIHLNGQTTASGTMQPEGQAGNTSVVKITCINVHLGEKLYNITVSYNVNNGGGSQTIPVSIRTSY